MKKRRKPNFIIQDYFRYSRLGLRWRKPRGRQSKLRKRKVNSGFVPKIGYGNDSRIKNAVNRNDKWILQKVVNNLKEMEKMEKGTGILIGSGVGAKKLMEFEKKANELGLFILNRRKMKKHRAYEYEIKKKLEEKKKETKKEESKKEEPKKHEHIKETPKKEIKAEPKKTKTAK